MSSKGEADYSRTLRLAAGSAAKSETELEERLRGSIVLVTADTGTSKLSATLRVLVANLRRLPVGIYLDPEGGDGPLDARLVAELVDLAQGIDPNRPLFLDHPLEIAVHVHVGARTTSATFSGVADGHGTRIRPHGQGFPKTMNPGSGLGAVLTGAMLTAEVFKVVVGVVPERQGRRQPVDFCPVSLAEPSPGRPESLPSLRDVALVGGGAIGTAVALILRELRADGSLIVVDPQLFEDPNVTTYSLGTREDARTQIRKVDLIQRELPGVEVIAFEGTAQDLVSAIDDGRMAMPEVVLGAVDSVEARHEIAAIHAQRTLDGSTGGDTGTMLSLAEATWAGPCLRCYYPRLRLQGPSVEQRISEMTGLTLDRIAHGQAVLTDAEVSALSDLPAQIQQKLREHINRPVCGLGRTLGLVGNDDDYRPSAAFVAQQAAALLVGSLIRGSSTPPMFVQYDALFGPKEGMSLPRAADRRCRCQQEADILRVVRARRTRVSSRTLTS